MFSAVYFMSCTAAHFTLGNHAVALPTKYSLYSHICVGTAQCLCFLTGLLTPCTGKASRLAYGQEAYVL